MTFGSFITVLGFLVVFRSNQAWSRYWEGATLVQEVRGVWLNSVSAIFAFSSRKGDDQARVDAFQDLIIRQMSLLFGEAMRLLTDEQEFVVLDQTGLDKDSVRFLDNGVEDREGRCEVILQWVQRALVDNSDILPIPPPIMSRVYQELGQGMVKINSARKIHELPLPFNYAQFLAGMLVLYAAGAPCVAAFILETWWGAAGTTFLNVCILWGVNYLAVEIENPFGDFANNLPLDKEVRRMNSLLVTLRKKGAQHLPKYKTRLSPGQKRESVFERKSIHPDYFSEDSCEPSGMFSRGMSSEDMLGSGLDSVINRVLEDAPPVPPEGSPRGICDVEDPSIREAKEHDQGIRDDIERFTQCRLQEQVDAARRHPSSRSNSSAVSGHLITSTTKRMAAFLQTEGATYTKYDLNKPVYVATDATGLPVRGRSNSIGGMSAASLSSQGQVRRALADGWVAHQSRSNGRVYFVNSATGKTQWDMPPAILEGLSTPPATPSGCGSVIGKTPSDNDKIPSGFAGMPTIQA